MNRSMILTIVVFALLLGALSPRVNAQDDWRILVEGDAYLSEVTGAVGLWEGEDLTANARLVLIGLASARRSEASAEEVALALNDSLLRAAVQVREDRGEEVIDAEAVLTAAVAVCPVWPLC